MKLNYFTLALIVALAVDFGLNLQRFPLTTTRAVGLGIAIPSFLLLVLSRVQLGRAFSVNPKAITLVTTGIYSRIRNPIYVFSSLMITGGIIWANYPWFLLTVLVLIPLQIYRSHKEAQVLEDKFGEAYLNYKRRTWL